MRKPTRESNRAYNEALGMTVNQILFEHRTTRKQLSEAFDVSSSVVTRKLRGEVSWSAEEVSILADLFGLRMDDFTPQRAEDGTWVPAPYVPGQQKAPAPAGAGAPTADAVLVAGTGFEPATSGL